MVLDIQKVTEIAQQHNLDLVMLFGSHAKGTATTDSDLDIGIYSKSGISDQSFRDIHSAFLANSIHNRIDLNIISGNNPLLMYSILVDGQVLYTTEETLADTLRIYAWKLLAESKSFRDHSFTVLKKTINAFA